MEIRGTKKENGMGGLGKLVAKMPIAEVDVLIGRNVKKNAMAFVYRKHTILCVSYEHPITI